jgi:hypothetical protein
MKKMVIPGNRTLAGVHIKIADKEEFNKHSHFSGNIDRVFVETGTHYAHGVIAAIIHGAIAVSNPNQTALEIALDSDLEIHSIEIEPRLFEYACNLMSLISNANADAEVQSVILRKKNFYKIRFSMDENELEINLYCGDSCKILPRILKKIRKRSTFWLDAHLGGYINSTISEEGGEFPIHRELEIIESHNIKDHTIMIDDMFRYRILYKDKSLEPYLYKINSDYLIEEIPKPGCPEGSGQTILIAKKRGIIDESL